MTTITEHPAYGTGTMMLAVPVIGRNKTIGDIPLIIVRRFPFRGTEQWRRVVRDDGYPVGYEQARWVASDIRYGIPGGGLPDDYRYDDRPVPPDIVRILDDRFGDVPSDRRPEIGRDDIIVPVPDDYPAVRPPVDDRDGMTGSLFDVPPPDNQHGQHPDDDVPPPVADIPDDNVPADDEPERLRPGPSRRPVNCGTYSGYRTHRNRRETPCSECVAAYREYERERKRKSRSRNDDDDGTNDDNAG